MNSNIKLRNRESLDSLKVKSRQRLVADMNHRQGTGSDLQNRISFGTVSNVDIGPNSVMSKPSQQLENLNKRIESNIKYYEGNKNGRYPKVEETSVDESTYREDKSSK